MGHEDLREEIEGIDSGYTESWGDYPLDTVFVRKENRTVAEVVKRIKNQRYKLDPEFQRDFVWNSTQQARLIESSLMRIPLPVLYVAEDKDGKIIVVDGLQRLTTFYNFLEDKFSLRDIDSNDENSLIRNKKFSQLPIQLQERIEDTQLTLYILDSKAPERARLDIFERVNSGVPLTRQQMRNCLYSGKSTRWLGDIAKSSIFQKVTGGSLDSKKMRDREAINRFCSFYIIGYKNYRGDMEEYLALALKAMNEMTDSKLEELKNTFMQTLDYLYILFGKHAFRKSIINYSDDGKSVLNISLFDALTTVISKRIKMNNARNKSCDKRKVVKLLCFDGFTSSISTSTNNTKQVNMRHSLLESMFDLESEIEEDTLIISLMVDDIVTKKSIYISTNNKNELINSATKLAQNPFGNKIEDLVEQRAQYQKLAKSLNVDRQLTSSLFNDIDRYKFTLNQITRKRA